MEEDNHDTQTEPPAASASVPSEPISFHILLIDDDPELHALLKGVLRRVATRISHAFSGNEALDFLREEGDTVDLILLDVMMPDVDGYDVCQAIRQEIGLTDVPIVLLTARGSLQDRRRALTAGANDFISKPFSPFELRERIAHWLSTSAAIRVARNLASQAVHRPSFVPSDRLLLINQLSHRLSTLRTPYSLLHEAVELIQAAMGYPFVGLAMWEGDDLVYTIAAGPLAAPLLTEIGGRPLPPDSGIYQAAREGLQVSVSDPHQAARLLPSKALGALYPRLIFPLRTQERVLGVLDVGGHQPNPLTEDEQLLLQTLADQIAVSLENARLYASLEESRQVMVHRARQLEVLTRAFQDLIGRLPLDRSDLQDLLGWVVRLVNAHSGLLILTDTYGEVIEFLIHGTAPLTRSRAHFTALRTHRVLGKPWRGQTIRLSAVIPAEQRDLPSALPPLPRALLGIPLCTPGRQWGLFYLTQAPGSDRTFTQTDQDLAEAFASGVALMLQNSELFNLGLEQAAERETLMQIAHLIGSRLEMDQVLANTLQAACELLESEDGAIWLVEEERPALQIVHSDGQATPSPHRLAPLQPLIERVVQRHRTLRLTQRELTAMLPSAPPSWVRSVLAVPLTHQEDVVGVVALFNKRTGPFDGKDRRLLSAIAVSAAAAIANARLHQQVRNAQVEWEATFNGITDGLIIYGSDLRVRRVNNAVPHLLRQPAEEIVGRTCREIFRRWGPSNGICFSLQTLQEGHLHQGEIETPDGKAVLAVRTYPLFDHNGEITGAVQVVRDVTQERLLQNRAIQTEKLAALGRLAASLAHEINNPLQAIHNSLHLLLQFPMDDQEREEILRITQEEVTRLMRIVEQTLAFARPRQETGRPLNLHRVLRNVLVLTRKQLQHSQIVVRQDLAPDLPPVLASEEQLSQVFLNLILNAIEAMPTGGELQITTRWVRDAQEAHVVFEDTGPGIPPEILPHLFEPFFTSKPDGTGLGLSISLSIVERYGGSIRAENRPQGGARFTIQLPALTLEAVSASKEEP